MKLDLTPRRPGAAVLLALLAPLASAQIATEQATLLPGDVAAGDSFGYDAGLDGDTAVVTAPFHDVAGDDAGAAYVFVRSGTDWAQQAKLLAGDAVAGDRFGLWTVLEGDTAVVAAPDRGAAAGGVYVFVRAGTSWSQQALLAPAELEAGDRFGDSLALSGDALLVGAPDDDDAGDGAGAAYVFTRAGTSWSMQAKLFAHAPAPGERFGHSVALEGDTALVASILGFGGAAGTGRADAFLRVGTAWTSQGSLFAADGASGDQLGRWLAVEGDTAVAGAYASDEAAPDAGAAYVFERTGGAWSEVQKLVASNASIDDFFGWPVSLDAGRLAVGAWLANEFNQDDTGAAYLFELEAGTWRETSRVLNASVAGGDGFGWCRLDGDTLLLTAFREDAQGADSGAAHVYLVSELTRTYCAGKPSSVGCVPFLAAHGLPSVSSTETFEIQAWNVHLHEAGLMLYGFGRSNLAFHGGTLCVKAPRVRLPPKFPLNYGLPPCAGLLRRNFNKTIQSAADPMLTVGQRTYVQFRQRDPADPTGFGDSLTDGVMFTIRP